MKLETKSLNLWYGKFQALIGVSLAIKPNAITAIIGPSGCGKSTLVRVFNRMNDSIRGIRMSGDVLLESQSIYDPRVRPEEAAQKGGDGFSAAESVPAVGL